MAPETFAILAPVLALVKSRRDETALAQWDSFAEQCFDLLQQPTTPQYQLALGSMGQNPGNMHGEYNYSMSVDGAPQEESAGTLGEERIGVCNDFYLSVQGLHSAPWTMHLQQI